MVKKYILMCIICVLLLALLIISITKTNKLCEVKTISLYPRYDNPPPEYPMIEETYIIKSTGEKILIKNGK